MRPESLYNCSCVFPMIFTPLPAACTLQLKLSKRINMIHSRFYKSSQEQMKDYLSSNIEGFPSRPLNYSQFSNNVGLYITIPQTTLHRVKLTSGLLPYKILTELSRHCLPKSLCFHIQSLNIQREPDQSSDGSISKSKSESVFGGVKEEHLDYQFRVQVISKNEHDLNNLASRKDKNLDSTSERKDHAMKSPISLTLPSVVGLQHLSGFHLIQTTQPSPLFSDSNDLEESSSVVAEAIFIFTVEDDLVVRHQITLTYPTFQSTLQLSSA